jgi:dTDP-glucose 4,6-dehydratase
MNLLITGGAGFIGSNFIRYMLKTDESCFIINIDLLTYASNPSYLSDVSTNKRYQFVKGDISNKSLINELINKYRIDCIINFAAESHVDNSIKNANTFIQTNVLGTTCLLDCAKENNTRLIQISTDEVYGSLSNGYADESFPLNPSSPYSASKAAADQFVCAYHQTYGLPFNIVRAANNYGPNQHIEKMIPQMLMRMQNNETLPVYGNGTNIRDWLYVEDFCRAIRLILHKGVNGEIYNISSHQEIDNLSLVKKLCDLMQYDEKQITFVNDRPGHDFRYGVDTRKIEALGWQGNICLDEGLAKTVSWYNKTGINWKF